MNLIKYYCIICSLDLVEVTMYKVELCPGKTILQAIAPKNISSEVEYLKEFSPIKINGTKRLRACWMLGYYDMLCCQVVWLNITVPTKLPVSRLNKYLVYQFFSLG